MNRGLKYLAVTQDNHTIHLRTQRADSAAYSLYPNGWYGIDNFSRFSRHIFIGGERIASVSGIHTGGMAEYDNQDLHTAGYNVGVTVGYDSLLAVQSSLITLYSDSLHAPFNGSPEAVRSVKYLGITGGLGMPGGNSEDNNHTDNSGRADNDRTNTSDSIFYYHRDHLGSTMSVTDCNARAVQTVEYTPWGEVFLEKRNGSFFYSPYLYNGKELDEETGLYYYGARYYDPKISVWYSTDPMQEKYPWVTTYGYCLGNPIAFIDFQGEKIVPWAISLNNHGQGVGLKYYSNQKFKTAMRIFGQTTYGKQLISSFLPDNMSQYGVRGNGKYAKYEMEILVGNYSNITEKFTAVRSKEGRFGIENDNGQLKFVFFVNTTERNVGEILETIAHEFALHGSHIDKLISIYENAKKNGHDGYEAALKYYNSDPEGRQDHSNLISKNMKNDASRTYIQVMNEILSINPKYKKEFENGLRNIERIEK